MQKLRTTENDVANIKNIFHDSVQACGLTDSEKYRFYSNQPLVQFILITHLKRKHSLY